jgi:Uma2 family endonuclease
MARLSNRAVVTVVASMIEAATAHEDAQLEFTMAIETATKPQPLFTADDLLAMPDDGKRYELVQGELEELPMSSHISSLIAARIIFELQAFVLPENLGHVTVPDGAYVLRENPATVRIPDVAFTRLNRLPPPAERTRFLRLAPDLVVEVISPSDAAAAINNKVQEYLDAGVSLVWVVYPERRMVQVFVPDRTSRSYFEGDSLDGGDVLPGFTLAVETIFAQVPAGDAADDSHPG